MRSNVLLRNSLGHPRPALAGSGLGRSRCTTDDDRLMVSTLLFVCSKLHGLTRKQCLEALLGSLTGCPHLSGCGGKRSVGGQSTS